MSAVILVARTIAEGRDWKRRRPDLGITHIVSPLTWQDGLRPSVVCVAPGAGIRDPEQFARLMRVLRIGLRRSAGTSGEIRYLAPDDRECAICHTTQTHYRGFVFVPCAGQIVCCDCDTGLAWVAELSPEDRANWRRDPDADGVVNFYERHML